ncbi:chloride channel protein [Lachnospiraceae bacterium HCP1S3_C3]|nr:chloride channel protein [Lachnospiraceae bacterium]
MESIKSYAKRIFANLKTFLKWVCIAVITGVIVGLFSIMFSMCLTWVTDFRDSHSYIVFLLPLAGCFIVFLYKIFNYSNNKGTNLVLSTIHADGRLEFKMAPLIFISTVITHLFGGSAGREGAALQLGGSIGSKIADVLGLDEQDQHVVIMCGMSAAFSALFGTPMAASIFAMEVVSVGVMYYAALVPCVFSALIASNFAADMGINPESFKIKYIPDMTLENSVKIIIIALACAALSVLFCMMLHGVGDLYRKYLKNPYVRIIVAGAAIALIMLLLGTDDYMGAGIPVIERAIAGEVNPFAFLLKMILTALTLEAGFKGGEIVPSFFIGATFGCIAGHILGISPSLCAAVGMIALFCGVTNCPITSLLISFELFGYRGVRYFMVAIAVSYLMSGYYGLYHDQTIVYSKYKAMYVNRKTR